MSGKETNGFHTIIPHGKILGRPCRQPKNTKNSVGYELGRCFQLDQTHCVLAASMDEQGGGDLCVGNDIFIFEKLSEIKAENAIPLNWPDTEYKLGSGPETGFLSKYPVTGCFVPKGAAGYDGKPHPGAGTGLFISLGITFGIDRKSIGQQSDVVFEFMQVSWDGENFSVTDRELCGSLLGHKLMGPTFSYFLPDGDSFLAPFTTVDGIIVFRFEFNNGHWIPVECGQPFMTFHRNMDELYFLPGEFEPSIAKRGNQYLIHTRGNDPHGRLYASTDGLNYQLLSARSNNTVPQIMSTGLDGSIYLATNPNLDMLRNPLVVYPLNDDGFDEPVIIHDEEGIRDDQGDKIPFVDHAVGVNLWLENRWRHFLWYRVCDLKERTMHAFMHDAQEKYHQSGIQSRSENGGLYMVELEYAQQPDGPHFL